MKLLLLAPLLLAAVVSAGNPIPNTPDGYVFAGQPGAQVVLEVFGDTMCPDTAGAWPTMKKVAQSYSSTQLQLVFHAYSLPFTHNSFLTNLGVAVVKNQTAATVFDYIEAIFANQNSLWNGVTKDMTMTQVIAKIADIAQAAGAIPSTAAFINGMADSGIYQTAVTSWKYSASRGIAGTPTFYINGVSIDADPQWSVSDWQSMIDPLLSASAAPTFEPEPEPAAELTLCRSIDEQIETSTNSTCPSGETSCEYVPGKYMCCYAGELCIKNEGCTCFNHMAPAPVCHDAQAEIPVRDNSTCPSGENSCEYVPGKYMCCFAGEMCIKNEGCTCAAETPVPMCREEDKEPEIFTATANCTSGQTQCEYVPGKYMCCYPGELCIKNEGCTCFADGVDGNSVVPMDEIPSQELSEQEAEEEALINNICGRSTPAETFFNTPPTCPSGEPLCEYLPGQYQCCLPTEMCLKNVGCRC